MSLEPCGSCQCEIDQNAKFCPYCGFKKEAVTPTTVKPTIEGLVQERVEQGWRISERRETDVVIEKGEKIPHVMHIFLTVVSFGIWGVIYAVNLVTGGIKRRRIEMHRGKVREKRLF